MLRGAVEALLGMLPWCANKARWAGGAGAGRACFGRARAARRACALPPLRSPFCIQNLFVLSVRQSRQCRAWWPCKQLCFTNRVVTLCSPT